MLRNKFFSLSIALVVALTLVNQCVAYASELPMEGWPNLDENQRLGIMPCDYNQGPVYYSGDHLFTGYITNQEDWAIHGNFYGSSRGIYYDCVMNQNDFYEIACLYSGDCSVFVYSGDYVCNRKPYTAGGEGVFFMFGGKMVLGAMPDSYEYLLKRDGKVEGVDYKKADGLCINLRNETLKIHGSSYRTPSNPDISEYRWYDDQPYAAICVYAQVPSKVYMYAGQIYWCSSSAITCDFEPVNSDSCFYGYGGEIFECSNYAVSTGGLCKDVVISGMDIHDNYNGLKNYDQCSMRIGGDNKIYNIINCSVENYGNLLVDGGEIYGNSIGVTNYGVMQQKTDIVGNHFYDVQAEAGRYENYDSKANVYLETGQIIHGMVAPSHEIGRVDVAPSDVYLGRVLYEAEYGTADATDIELVTVDLTFGVVNTQGQMEQRNAVALKGNGVSGAKTQIILSVPIKVSYGSDFEGVAGFTQDTFWATEFIVASQAPSYVLNGNCVDGSFIFKGWDWIDDRDDLYAPGQVISAEVMKKNGPRDVLFKDRYEVNFDLYYDGNKPTSGENKLVKNVTLDSSFEDNWFKKDGYVWLAWWDAPIGNYKVLKDGILSLREIFYKALAANRYELDEDTGHITITVYCLWDKIPIVHDAELFLKIDEIKKQSPDDVQKGIEDSVEAEDEEDGKIPVKVKDFSYDELTSPTLIGGGTSFECAAVDGAGNEAFGKVFIHIVPDEILFDEKGVRYIDEENYKKSSPTKGGLEENSLWYVNEDYKNLITEAFERLKSL